MNRITSIDIMKGLGIILVVLGHAIQKNVPDYQTNLIFNIIYSCHMPLFFVISGYLMKKSVITTRMNWFAHKAIYLLIPHVIFDIIIYYFSASGLPNFDNLPEQFSFSRWIVESLFLNNGEWFLWTLFVIFSIMLLLNFIESRVNNFLLWIFLLSFIFGLEFVPNLGKDYLRMLEIQWYLPFALVGYIAAKYDTVVKKFNWLILAGLVLYPLSMWATSWSGGWTTYPLNGFVFYLGSGDLWIYTTLFVQALTGISIIALITRFTAKIGFLSRFLGWLGSMTLGIYLFSQLISGLGLGTGWVMVFSAFISSLLLGIALTVLCRKVKYFGIILGDMNWIRVSFLSKKPQ